MLRASGMHERSEGGTLAVRMTRDRVSIPSRPEGGCGGGAAPPSGGAGGRSPPQRSAAGSGARGALRSRPARTPGRMRARGSRMRAECPNEHSSLESDTIESMTRAQRAITVGVSRRSAAGARVGAQSATGAAGAEPPCSAGGVGGGANRKGRGAAAGPNRQQARAARRCCRLLKSAGMPFFPSSICCRGCP